MDGWTEEHDTAEKKYMPGNIFQEIKIQYTFEITDGIKQSHSKKNNQEDRCLLV